MMIFKFVTPSELFMLKVLALGFFFGWYGKRIFRMKSYEIDNLKYFNIKERGKFQ